ncbi:D,D-heptose 1,7-bisphosphate phosphatase [Alteribacter lacisalsi]|uniref:D,D-heptose 1,7-bisphosphate phosphatase n=1 Tax=Alteribacter lacisalsi TaxID=2045244 RepID=A0A2W0HI24_9BACI|nr:HAD-IIIA family hydrolase [Alteribacter lacisalsi]PYZ96622.1 D,D-heptose 1,7-bisphosphate phosphatase [Alteribacter lacisalsi]
MKAAFFDRDGTIIEDYPDHEWTHITQPVFKDGAIHVLKEVTRKGYAIIIITNQYIIEEGYITLDQYNDINSQMVEELGRHGINIHDIYYCPHARTGNCACIKPRTGMIEKALSIHPGINLNESFMIGDSAADVELAINLGIKGFGIGIGSAYRNVHEINTIKELTTFL